MFEVMLVFGDLAWVPFTYVFQAFYLLKHTPEVHISYEYPLPNPKMNRAEGYLTRKDMPDLLLPCSLSDSTCSDGLTAKSTSSDETLRLPSGARRPLTLRPSAAPSCSPADSGELLAILTTLETSSSPGPGACLAASDHSLLTSTESTSLPSTCTDAGETTMSARRSMVLTGRDTARRSPTSSSPTCSKRNNKGAFIKNRNQIRA